MQPRTDLHCHFAGVLSPDELIELAFEHSLELDAETAIRTGVVSKTYEGGAISLHTLTEDQLNTLKNGLQLNADRQSLFDDLEVIYKNRAFITKNPAMFGPMLDRIGQAYQDQGVEYAELSFAGIIGNSDYMRTIHEKLPEIEERTGVKLRFLAALWRHSDHEWNMDEADRLKQTLKSPYVVGIDVMGHEKNPIRDLSEPLQKVVQYASEHVPHCVVRIHAGENPYYSADPDHLDDWSYNNAYESIQIVDDARKNGNGGYIGNYGENLQIRIGHGRYGQHPKTMELARNAGVISELCLTSNKLLNHADEHYSLFDLYREHGVPFVLGSDGYGIYSTTLSSEADLAIDSGMDDEGQRVLSETENRVLAADDERFELKMRTWQRHVHNCTMAGKDPFEALHDVVFETLDGKPRYDQEVGARKAAKIKALHDNLMVGLGDMGVSTNLTETQSLLKERQPILFSGASKSSWAKLSETEKDHVEETLRTFIDQLEGREQVIVTGGTNYGFEAVVHRLVAERNASLPGSERIPVIGAVTLEANLDEIAPNTLSHALVLKYGGDYAMSWMDQSPALLDMIERHDGRVIFGGGGQVIRDMIVDADGRDLIDTGQALLFDGPAGASTEKANQFPQASFREANDLIAKIGPRRRVTPSVGQAQLVPEAFS